MFIENLESGRRGGGVGGGGIPYCGPYGEAPPKRYAFLCSQYTIMYKRVGRIVNLISILAGHQNAREIATKLKY